MTYASKTAKEFRQVKGTLATKITDELADIDTELDSLSLQAMRIARATYDFDVDGGATGDIGLGVTLPDNAILVHSWYQVLTTFTSATSDTATVALGIPTDDAAGIVAALAIADGSNIWDAGNHETIQDGTAAAFSEKCTAARELTLTIGVEAATAGKLILWCEYVVSV